jgi:hypothetical protein
VGATTETTPGSASSDASKENLVTTPTPVACRTRRWPRSIVALAASVALLLLTGCGDDGADTASSTTGATTTTTPASTTETAAEPVEAGLEEFCAVARELTEQDSLPTAAQLAEYQSLAPEEIAEPTAVVVAAFEAAGDTPQSVFADEEATAAIQELGAFEADACGIEPPQDPSVTEIDPNATRVDVTAVDHFFDVELPTTAGRYSFVMANTGAEPHLMVIAHLEDDAVLDEVLASEGDEGVITTFESAVVAPGAEGAVTADLGPGRWVLVCPIPDADGVSHVELGMVAEFTVG